MLRDLTVRLDTAHPVVSRLIVAGGRWSTYVVPGSLVAGFADAILLRVADVSPLADLEGDIALEDDELLLRRDVLDTQIVDIDGYHLDRVGDVLLAGEWPALTAVAVEIGAAAVLRRLRLGPLAARLPERAVDWEALHLTSHRGHEVQLRTRVSAVHQLDALGLAELITRLDLTQAVGVVRAVDPGIGSSAIGQLQSEVATDVLAQLDREEAAHLLDLMHEERAGHLRSLLRRASPRRRLHRTGGWRRRRLPGADHG